MAVEAVFGAETVWHCEKDAAASKVLAARWPDVPNHHDLTETDWATVEPVDIIAAGWPCQPWSLAGKRKGAEDERAIWPEIARAVRELRPRFVVLENVSAVVVLGELARAAGDLAEAGYDAQWCCVSASEVGAPHKRERFFAVAADAGHGDEPERSWQTGRETGQRASIGGLARRDSEAALIPTPRASDAGPRGGTTGWGMRNWVRDELLPTPRTSDTNGAGAHGQGGMDLRTAVSLLPTPNAADGNGGGRYSSDGHQTTLPGEARLLCTPSASDGAGGKTSRSGARIDEPLLGGQAREMEGGWGKYEPAIRRWEALTRPAPAPTEPNRNGNPRLNPAFSEWMMGWPADWVTQVEGISRNDQLRIIGNGVIPQCAAAAIRWLLSLEVVA